MQPIYKPIYVLTTFMTVAVYFYFYGIVMVFLGHFYGYFTYRTNNNSFTMILTTDIIYI